MPAYPDPSAIVLVAILPKVRDLEIARLLGWYRIPLRTAPKIISVDAVAFYQPNSFGKEHGGRIECWAELHGHELTTRRELFKDQQDHPRANEEYYKLQIGPLVQLPGVIRAERWKRVIFLYTTGLLIHSAATLNDLVMHTDEREIVWRSLRERAIKSGNYHEAELPEELIDPILCALFGSFDRPDSFSH